MSARIELDYKTLKFTLAQSDLYQWDCIHNMHTTGYDFAIRYTLLISALEQA